MKWTRHQKISLRNSSVSSNTCARRPAIHFSYFAFRKYFRETPQNTKHSLYTFRVSYEFCVLLMLQKNKPQNSFTFRTNADPGARCYKMQKAKKGVWNAKKVTRKYPTIHFSFFTFCDRFRIFRDKCIASLAASCWKYTHLLSHQQSHTVFLQIFLYSSLSVVLVKNSGLTIHLLSAHQTSILKR